MADRIRPVHSSSRSRTRAPTLQFGRSFNLLRRQPRSRSRDHVFRASCDRRTDLESRRPSPRPQALNIDRFRWHLRPRFPESRGRKPGDRPPPQHCPAFARCSPKIPFFCPAADTPRGLFSRRVGGKWGDQRMTIKASGRSALILAAGLFVCFAEPSQAAAGAEDTAAATKSETAGAPIALHKYVKHGARHGKKYAHRELGKVALKASTGDNDGRRGRRRRPFIRDPAVGCRRQCATGSSSPTSADARPAMPPGR